MTVLATQEQDPYVHVYVSTFDDEVPVLGKNMRLVAGGSKDGWYDVGGGPVWMRRLTFVNAPNAV